jgi:hypothetical protein
MNTMQESKMVPPIFIGRWTPKVLFSLKERPHRHGQLRRRIGRINHQTRDEIEVHRCRVFLDPPGEDAHRSTHRYVPLGETTWPARQC